MMCVVTGMRARAGIWFLVALAIGASGCRGDRREAPARPDPPPVAQGVSARTLQLVDPSRSTTDRRRGTETAGRTINTRVYYPASGAGPFPIVVFSHGLRGTPDDYRLLLEHWAREGLVVVAPEYPLTSRNSEDVMPGDLVNQPADASFALTQVLADESLRAIADAKHVAAAGHSEGALTTYGLFTMCCRDTRLSAGIVLAGNSVGFRDQLEGPPASMLFVHGDADQVINIGLGQAAYARVPWRKAFLTLEGGAHIPPYLGADNPAARVVTASTTDFLRWTLRRDATALDTLRRDAAVPGVAHLEGNLE